MTLHSLLPPPPPPLSHFIFEQLTRSFSSLPLSPHVPRPPSLFPVLFSCCCSLWVFLLQQISSSPAFILHSDDDVTWRHLAAEDVGRRRRLFFGWLRIRPLQGLSLFLFKPVGRVDSTSCNSFLAMTLRSQSDRFVANLSLVSNSKAAIGSGTLKQTGTVFKKLNNF